MVRCQKLSHDLDTHRGLVGFKAVLESDLISFNRDGEVKIYLQDERHFAGNWPGQSC